MAVSGTQLMEWYRELQEVRRRRAVAHKEAEWLAWLVAGCPKPACPWLNLSLLDRPHEIREAISKIDAGPSPA